MSCKLLTQYNKDLILNDVDTNIIAIGNYIFTFVTLSFAIKVYHHHVFSLMLADLIIVIVIKRWLKDRELFGKH